MSTRSSLRSDVSRLEDLLNAQNWEALAAIEYREPTDAPGDLDELLALRSDVERLRRRVGDALEETRAQLDETPRTRRAARAYLSAPGADTAD